MKEIVILLAVGLVLFLVIGTILALTSENMKRECEARGGWFTYIGGYASCLPPGAR